MFSRDDAKADRLTFIWVAIFLGGFLIVDILSNITERDRFDHHFTTGEIAIYEITSVAVLLALFALVARVVSLATPGQHEWRIVVPVHIAAAVALSVVHVASMVALRKAAFAIVYGKPYIFTNNLMRDFVYEFRKDALVYLLFVFFITFGRQLMQQRRELAAAREDARTSQRITLKCGGRSIFVDADAVRYAKSAANYVEVNAGTATHLARSTLTAIEQQLSDAGARVARIHRSYVVNTAHVAAVKPTGEGDVKVEMSNGDVVPGSRRYRDRLASIDA